MLGKIVAGFMIILLSLTVLSHCIRIIFMLLKKENVFTKPPTKVQLILYYILTIGSCIYAVFYQLKIFNS